jgi:hypothetical protein
MKKAYILFIVVAILMNTFIYFYPADIFQVKTVNNVFKDATLKGLLSSENGVSFSLLTVKGWFMLFICSIGIPGIIGWRSTLQKYGRKKGEEKKSIYDKLK